MNMKKHYLYHVSICSSCDFLYDSHHVILFVLSDSNDFLLFYLNYSIANIF